MILRYVAPVVALFAGLSQPAYAEPTILCSGTDPDWKLGITSETADLTYKRHVRLKIPQSTSAINRDWPKAFTLIARTDTAIVVLDRDACLLDGKEFPISVDVLTQDGSAAIMLTGCCQEPVE